MNLLEIKAFLAEHAAAAVFVTIIVAPTVWTLSSLHYKERISVLETYIALLEKRLKEPMLLGLAGASPLPGQSQSVTSAVPASTPTTPSQEHTLGQRYPAIANPTSLSKSEVRALATFYGLMKDWPTNPHLRFLDGDVSYWHEQGLSESRLKAEFEARRQVLEEAENQRKRLGKQGDLSHLANERVPLLLTK